MDELIDVATTSPSGDSAPSESAPSSSASETSVAPLEQVAGGETATDVVAPEQQESDPLAGLPSQEELEQQVSENVPYAKALAQLRSAYEGVKPLKALESWKDVATQFSDPSEVIAQRDLIGKIHSPVPDRPGEFTTVPFLNDLETQSPGTTKRMLFDAAALEVEENGVRDTQIRHWIRSWGLDPDRFDDYREIDARAPAGVVTQDQLAGIDQKFHAAFKALSQAQREDILLQGAVEKDDYGNLARDERGNIIPPRYPAAVMDYLQDKSEALEARQWREQDQQRERDAAQARQQEFEQATNRAVDEDISTVRREMYDAIHQHLASQVKLSSDENLSKVEYRKVMGSLASLLVPEIRWTTEEALKDAGVAFDAKAFDELVNGFAGARESYVRLTRQGDQMRARQALAASNLAKAQLRVKLDDYALALAEPTANRLQTQSQNLVTSLQGATARVIPSGTVQPASSNGNPYMENPHALGTPEYLAFNRQIDRQHGLNGAAALAR
jgi:hypothetical protein